MEYRPEKAFRVPGTTAPCLLRRLRSFREPPGRLKDFFLVVQLWRLGVERSSDGTSGRLYKIDLTSGKVVGWAQTILGRGEDDAGRMVHEIGCKDPNVVYLGSAILWNVTKVTIRP